MVVPGDHLIFHMFLFLLGRVCFIAGYLRHPNARIFGFNLGGFQLNVVLTCFAFVVLRSLGVGDSARLWAAIFVLYPLLAHFCVVGLLPRVLRSAGLLPLEALRCSPAEHRALGVGLGSRCFL